MDNQKDYSVCLDETGGFFLLDLQEKFPHIQNTTDLIFAILSFQKQLIWSIDEQIWKIDRKVKRRGKFDLDKFAKRFTS